MCASGYNIVALGEAHYQGFYQVYKPLIKYFILKFFSLILGGYQPGMTEKSKDGHFKNS
jgi:hypothetical protein